MNYPLYRFLMIAGVSTLLTACGDEGNDDSTSGDATIETEVWGFDSKGGNSYAVPSPNELFSLIKASKLPYKEGLISSESHKYTSSKVQALNFGRLTADIAYTASYEKFQESINNFDNLRKVGDDLGISYVFDEILVNRVKQNMSNSDSLEIISNSSYQRIIQQLEDGEKGSTLAIIAAGGFVESIYILSHLIGTYDEKNPLLQRLADQKLVMENILDYLNIYADEQRVQEVLEELQPISDVYLNLDEQSSGKSVDETGDKTVLGGNKIVITKAEFEKLQAAATAYRNLFAQPSQG